MNPQHLAFLQEIGLNEAESRVYEVLTSEGEAEARELVERTGLGRGNTYNTVAALEKRGFVVAVHGGAKTVYRATDPSNLRTLLERRQEEVQALRARFDAFLPSFSSQYTLSTGKPSIQIFEGMEGFRQVLEDSLTAQGEILTMVDTEAIQGEVLRIEEEYIAKRIKKKLPKRVLLPDSAMAREWASSPSNSYTMTRVSSAIPRGFCAGMQLYGPNASMLSLREGKIVSLLITDVSFSSMLRAMFEGLWSAASSIAPERE